MTLFFSNFIQPLSCKIIKYTIIITIYKYLAGHLGGAQQLGAQIAHNQIDMVIFLRDPISQKPHEPDLGGIERLCDSHNIPIATNLATAELLVKALERGDLSWREVMR